MKKQVIAHQKFIRQTPQKLRLVAGMIRLMRVKDAQVQLGMSSKRGAITMSKVLTQAKANAVSTGLRVDSLTIHEIQVNEGPTYKRWNPVSRGRAHRILKRTCHIKIVVEGSTEPTKPTKSTSTTKEESKKKGK